MNKINFQTGTIIPPELMNALQNQSFTNDEEEAGHLPLPPNYGEKVQVFVTENCAVDLSSASSGFAVVEHYGSTTSVQPVTITINGIGDNGAKTILLVTRGTNYPVTVSLPKSANSREEISIKGGSSVLLTYYSYSGGLVWKYYEFEKTPVAMIDTGWKSFDLGGVGQSFVKIATLTIPKGYSAIVKIKGIATTTGDIGTVVDYIFQAIDANNNEERCTMSVVRTDSNGEFLPSRTSETNPRNDDFEGYLVIPPLSTPAQRSVDLKIKTSIGAPRTGVKCRALLYKANLDTTLLA
ncbi:MAG: hypothetical protein IKN70_09795 [Fibrobacter sp.]|nr:hypothetical protein [Fibrobacter sp.]